MYEKIPFKNNWCFQTKRCLITKSKASFVKNLIKMLIFISHVLPHSEKSILFFVGNRFKCWFSLFPLCITFSCSPFPPLICVAKNFYRDEIFIMQNPKCMMSSAIQCNYLCNVLCFPQLSQKKFHPRLSFSNANNKH